MTSRPSSQNGSVLILVLLLSVLLFAVVGGLALYLKSQRALLETQRYWILAKQNAQVGLDAALKQLEKYALEDGVLTCNGSFLALSDKEKTHWLAATVGDQLHWLVSGELDALEDLPIFEGDVSIDAPSVAIGKNGRYAYWIGDENQKAYIASKDPETSEYAKTFACGAWRQSASRGIDLDYTTDSCSLLRSPQGPKSNFLTIAASAFPEKTQFEAVQRYLDLSATLTGGFPEQSFDLEQSPPVGPLVGALGIAIGLNCPDVIVPDVSDPDALPAVDQVDVHLWPEIHLYNPYTVAIPKQRYRIQIGGRGGRDVYCLELRNTVSQNRRTLRQNENLKLNDPDSYWLDGDLEAAFEPGQTRRFVWDGSGSFIEAPSPDPGQAHIIENQLTSRFYLSPSAAKIRKKRVQALRLRVGWPSLECLLSTASGAQIQKLSIQKDLEPTWEGSVELLNASGSDVCIASQTSFHAHYQKIPLEPYTQLTLNPSDQEAQAPLELSWSNNKIALALPQTPTSVIELARAPYGMASLGLQRYVPELHGLYSAWDAFYALDERPGMDVHPLYDASLGGMRGGFNIHSMREKAWESFLLNSFEKDGDTVIYRRSFDGKQSTRLTHSQIQEIAASIIAQNQALSTPFRNLEDWLNADIFGQALATLGQGTFHKEDLLQALGPLLAVRGDSFWVRSRGEALNPSSGKTEAIALRDSLIQRVTDSDGTVRFRILWTRDATD